MFEIARALDDVTQTNVMYHVHLRLFERDRFFGHDERVERMRAIMRTDELRLIPTIEAVVAEIEQDAGAPIESLSEDRVGVYVRELEAISNARRQARPGYNPERGRRLLDEMLREVGFAA